MGDDDLTPPSQPTPRPNQLTDSQRDERRRALGIPAAPVRSELSEQLQLLDREELTPSEQELIRRSRHDSDAPVPFRHFVKVVDSLTRMKRDDSGARSRDPHTEALIKVPLRVDALEKSWSTWSKVGLLIAGALGTVAIWLADKISSSAERVGTQTEQLRTLERDRASCERDIRELQNELRDLRRGKENP